MIQGLNMVNGRGPGALISKIFISIGFLMPAFGPDSPACAYPIIKWEYTLWFFIFALIWDRNREPAEFGTRILRLMIGVWCIYPIIFVTTLVGVYFLIGVKSHSPNCIDSRTTTSALVLIAVGFTLSVFVWGGMLYYLSKFFCKVFGKIVPRRFRPTIRLRYFRRNHVQTTLTNKMTESELEQFKKTNEFEISESTFSDCESTETKTDCSICFSEMKIQEKALRLNCDHFFHTPCVAEWLKRNNKCPLCKKRVDGRAEVESNEDDEAVRNFLEFQTMMDHVNDTGGLDVEVGMAQEQTGPQPV